MQNTEQKKPATEPSCTAALLCLGFILVTAAVSCGCLGTLPFPDIGRLSFPHFNGTSGNLNVYFFDVGQGDSTLIVFKNTTILVDAGESDKGDVVVRDIQSLGISRIDLLVATHPHSDHIGGMDKVLDSFDIGQVVDAGMPHPSPLYRQFLDAIESRHIPYTVAHEGQSIDPDPALRILVLSPPSRHTGDDLNDNSVVLRISYGTFDVLLTGDADMAAEDRMLASGYALDAEVLKVAHHGSTSSTGPRFLERVHPDVAVISAGAGNPYGHPADETLAALERAGSTVYRTDLDGDIRVTSDGITYTVQASSGNGKRPVPVTTTVPVKYAATTTTASYRYDVVISETRFNAPGDDRTNLNGEYVRITNPDGPSVNVNGWTLSDRTGTRLYVFPAFILLPNSSVYVYTGTGAINDTALFMGRTAPAWSNSGDDAVLRDGRGNIVDKRSEGGTN
jgi:beta-lactamase superfamily II metal-dependent hydrolase